MSIRPTHSLEWELTGTIDCNFDSKCGSGLTAMPETLFNYSTFFPLLSWPQGSIDEVREKFQELALYCARDVHATFEVFTKVCENVCLYVFVCVCALCVHVCVWEKSFQLVTLHKMERLMYQFAIPLGWLTLSSTAHPPHRRSSTSPNPVRTPPRLSACWKWARHIFPLIRSSMRTWGLVVFAICFRTSFEFCLVAMYFFSSFFCIWWKSCVSRRCHLNYSVFARLTD